MPADVELGLFFLEEDPNLGHIMSGIASDVGHIDVDIFHLEEQVLWVLQAYDMVVDVAMNSPQRLEGCELFGGFNVPDVAGMPYLIHVLEEIKDLRDEGSVGIR